MVFPVVKGKRGTFDSVGHSTHYAANVGRVGQIVCIECSIKQSLSLPTAPIEPTFMVFETQHDVCTV